MLKNNDKIIKNPALVWLPVESYNKLLLNLRVTDFTGNLPFFISYDEKKQLMEGGIHMEPGHLLFGILIGLDEFDNKQHIKLWMNNTDRDRLVDILYVLQHYFKKESFEILIIDAADLLGDHYGSNYSNVVLKTGLSILPESVSLKTKLMENS